MRRASIFRWLVIVGLAAALVLAGCERGERNVRSNPPQNQPAAGVVIPAADPSSGLDQLDSQLNGIQQDLDHTYTVEDFQ